MEVRLLGVRSELQIDYLGLTGIFVVVRPRMGLPRAGVWVETRSGREASEELLQ